MAELPESVKGYLCTWLKNQRSMGFMLLDRSGQVLTYGGDLQGLGIATPEKGRPIDDQVNFMEGLIPTDLPSLYLPMIKTDANRSIDLHLFQTDEGYGLLLMDVTDKACQLTDLQQKVNDLVLLHEQQSQAMADQLPPDRFESIESLLLALDTVALTLESDNRFTLIGQPPQWLTSFYPEIATERYHLTPENVFYYLDNFLYEANEFWESGAVGCVKSGLWIETDDAGTEHLFEAVATNTTHRKILLIFHEKFNAIEKRHLIQKGRELALDHGLLRRMQKDLEIHQNRLEERVKKRTQELEEANADLAEELEQRKQLEQERSNMMHQLQQAQKMEAIGTLAGGIAHDFNNLLMGILGRTSLMAADSNGHHDHLEHLNGIKDYVKSAADLTKQLLAFAKGGKYEVKPTDLSILLDKSAAMFGRTRKEITIHKKREKDIWTVDVDQTQIEQVMMNLYVNAWQSMPGGGKLYLESKNVVLEEDFVRPHGLAAGRYVKISVKDTGIGMDQTTQNKIFEPFFTTKEMGRGTGLGLASAYGIIKNHDGIISVNSEKGKGATFNIYLPASEKEAIRKMEFEINLIKGNETALLVDDEDIIIEVGAALLEKLGYKVLTAKSGKLAIELYTASTDKIDIIILDMIMPEMSGGDTYDRLKEINPAVRVLLSSGYSINGQANEILERGCCGFIQKPFDLKHLSQKLREILDKQ